MDEPIRGRLGPLAAPLRWLFAPRGEVGPSGRSFLLGQLLQAPAAAVMGSFCATVVIGVALLRSGAGMYAPFAALELLLLACRLGEWRRLKRRTGRVAAVDASALLSTLWCALQGALAFTIMAEGDPVLRVLSATLVMAMIGPICARNYAAPRFAFLLVLLCDLPFVGGAVASGEPWLLVIVPITPPFLFGAMQIIAAFHQAILTTLAAEERNLHLAQHDSLTGMLNRHGLDAALAAAPREPGRQLALISIDLDGFKQVNDSYGHGAGDLLLVAVAERIRARLEPGPLLARMGGDEFVVVVRDAAPDAIASLVEELVAVVSNQPYTLGNGVVARVGASIGFACLPEDAADTVELRLRADEALYAAKGAGKGRALRYGAVAPEAGERRAPFTPIQARRGAG